MAVGTRAKRSDPALWDEVKAEISQGDKGGQPGQRSARKAQMAVQAYNQRGGGHEGRSSLTIRAPLFAASALLHRSL